MPARTIIDVSTLSRWAGPPVGIVRVECELARWAAANIDDLTFAFFDPETKTYRAVRKEWVAPLLARAISVNPWIAPSTHGRRRRSDRIPRAIKPAVMWFLQSRRSSLLLLERIRRRAGHPAFRAAAAQLQRPLITKKYRPYMYHADGTRKAIIGLEEYLGPDIAFAATDTLICAGAPWEHSDIDVIKKQKERVGFRFVVLCFDIIPLLTPRFYKSTDVASFQEYFKRAFPLADVIVCNAEVPRRDAVAYCKSQNLKIGETCVVPLGANGAAVSAAPAAALPPGLERGRYALFVSTIEPRKGHQMLVNVWLRLLTEGLPQKFGFKLVFVGRPGWQVEALLDQLKNDSRLRVSLHFLQSVNDRQLAALYDGAAFCLYPSAYEGYGLPIIEAFSRGKAVLASTGGAIPEVVADFSPCLDPRDEAQWQAMLAQWISDPAARAPYETAIRTRFRPITWSQAAQMFFAAAQRPQ